MSAIYDCFEEGILLPDKTLKGLDNYSYVCLTCKSKGLKKNVDEFTYKCDAKKTSNLVNHLKTKGHEDAKLQFDLKTSNKSLDSPLSKKCKLEIVESNLSPFKMSSSVKYKRTDLRRIDRCGKLVRMLVKCMLPISIVDNPGFREYINFIDPSFTIPSRKTIKDTSLPKMKEAVETKITNIMKTIKQPNVCTSFRKRW